MAPIMRGVFIDGDAELRALATGVRRQGEALPDFDATISRLCQLRDWAALSDRLTLYDVVFLDHSNLPASLFTRNPQLRHVVFLGTGVRSVLDVEALVACGVTVHAVPDYANLAVAEHALALIYAAARRIAASDRDLKAGLWRTRPIIQLAGKTLGLIGVGGIGRELARLGGAVGLRVIAWNRSPTEIEGVAFQPIDTVLGDSDVISLHLMLTPETECFLNADRIARLRPGVILVNTARARLVDQDAMRAALVSGAIGHAALDVFEPEPPAPDDPLLRLENVTLTPHCAFRTPEAARTLMRRALDIAATLE